MTFLAPGWLLLGGLTALVLVLHMRNRRRREVPSVLIWQMLQNTAVARRSLRAPPPSLLLALQLLVVVLATLALAQPQLGGRDAPAHTIYVLDASGSMRATDLAPSRFTAARQHLLAAIAAEAADSRTRISVVHVDAAPRIHVARQREAAGILPLAEDLQAGDGAADWEAAVALVATIRRDGEATRIVVLTDGADPAAADFQNAFADIAAARVFAGADAANVGLMAALAPAADLPGTWRVTGTVQFGGATPPDVVLEALFQPSGGGAFTPLASTRVARRGGPPSVAFDLMLELPGPGAVELRLPDDAGPHDNAMYFVVDPGPVRARVLYVGAADGPLLIALQAMDAVELLSADRLPADDHTFDLVVVDGVAVARRPATNVLWLGAAHAGGQPPPAPLGAPYITGWDTTHRLSDQLDWTSIAPPRAYRVERLPGATVLAEATHGPLVQARTTPAGREIQVAFDLAGSGWADSAGLPLFLNNVMRWLGPATQPCVVGVACSIEARRSSAQIIAPDGTTVSRGRADAEFLLSGADAAFVPARAGLYALQSGESRRWVAVNRAGATETALAPLGDGNPVSPPDQTLPPLWRWLLVTALVALIAETWIAGRGSEQFLTLRALAYGRALAGRRRAQLGLRAAAIGLVVAALAGAPIAVRELAERVVLVVGPDLVAENPNAGRALLLRDVDGTLAADGRDGNAGIVAAGGASRVALDIGGATGARDPAFRALPAGTNLEAATFLAAAMLPADAAGRIVLATDGNETAGQVARAVAAAQARNIAIDVAPITEVPAGEVLVESVHAPQRVYLGDTFLLDAVIYAQAAGEAHVTIQRAGATVLEQDLDLLPGRNRVETVVPAREVGELLLEVSIESPRDTFVQNNRNGVIVQVGPSPAIAIVTADTAAGESLARALAVQGLTAKVVGPYSAPKKVDGWLAYDAVVTMNLPAIQLDTEQQDSLEQFVHVHGRGLLILGGENSFGPGGYFGTAFERMSPLSSRIPHETPDVAIVFVLDRSGSMVAWADPARSYTRLDVTKEATLAAVAQLPDEARVGIVAFDHEAHVVLPLQEQKDEPAVARALGALVAGGGTFIYPGLAAAVDMLRSADVTARHIVVMTDGLSQTADFAPLFAEAKRLGITMSAIAVSSAADPAQPLLIAEGGGGGFYRTDDVRALPSILLQETLMLSSAPLKRMTAPVAWVSAAPFLAGLPATLPPVEVYVRTTLQPQADLHLTVTDERGEHEPLLASWRYGNGRVLAFATHGAGPGTVGWLQMPEYPLLWAQAIRHSLPDAKGPGLSVSVHRSGDSVRVAADALDKLGAPLRDRTVIAATAEVVPVVLKEIGPGRYEGTLALPEPGVRRIAVTAGDLRAAASIYVAYPARFDFARADFDKLHALALATGGRLLVGDAPTFNERRRWVARPGWRLWTVLALALVLLELTLRYAPQAFALVRRFRAITAVTKTSTNHHLPASPL